MIKELKRAAEFLGEDVIDVDNSPQKVWVKDEGIALNIKIFNPHEKEGRHLLVEMLRKLDNNQFEAYVRLMVQAYLDNKEGPLLSMVRLIVTAPSKLCFEKIMEVI